MGDWIEVQLLDKLHNFLNEFETEGRVHIWSRSAFNHAYKYDPSVEWTDKKCTMRAIKLVKTFAIFCHNADWSSLDESLLGEARNFFVVLKDWVVRIVEDGELGMLHICLFAICRLRVVAAKLYGKLVKPPLGVVLDEFALSAQQYVMDVPPRPIGWGRTPHDYAIVEACYSLTAKNLESLTYLLSKTTSDHKKTLQPSVGALILSILRLAHASDVHHTETAQEEETILRSSSEMSLKLSPQYILDTPMMFLTVDELLQNLFNLVDHVVLTNIMHKINLINLEFFLKPNVTSVRDTQSGEALSIFIRFFEEPSEYMKDQEIFILKLIEYFLREIAVEDMILESSLQILGIFKAKALFMRLGHNASNYTDVHSIDTPHKRSFLSFREFLSGTSQCSAVPQVLYSGDTAEAEPNQLSSKIELNFEDVTAIYEQGCLSSFDDFIQSGRVVFVDNLLGNLRKYLNNHPRAFNILKDQIATLLLELELVGSFLIDVTEKKIWLQGIRLIHEVEYVLDMFLLGDAPLWYHQLLIFNAIKELRQLKAQFHHESFEFDDQAKIIVHMLQNGSEHLETRHYFWSEFLDEGAEEYWRNYVYQSYVLNSSSHLTDKNSTMRAISFLKTIQYAYGAEWIVMDENKNLEAVCERRNKYLRWLDREILECDDPWVRKFKAFECLPTIGLLRTKFGDICEKLMKVPHPALFLDLTVFDQVAETVQHYVMNVPKAPLGWGHSPRDYSVVEENYRDTVVKMEGFRHLVCSISEQCVDQKKLQSLLSHAASFIFSILHMARRIDVREIDGTEMEEIIFSCSFDMSQKLLPQDAMKVYLDLLSTNEDVIEALEKTRLPVYLTGSAESFLNVLQSARNQARVLGEFLEFSLMDLITENPHDQIEKVEILLKRGRVVFTTEASSLLSCIPGLHSKLNHIKGEIFVLEFLNMKATFTDSDNRVDIVRKFFRSLTQIFKMPLGDDEKSILQLIQTFLREAGSLCELSEDGILESSLLILRLYKAETLFMLLRHTPSSFKFLAQFRMATVHKILLFFRKLLSEDENMTTSIRSFGDRYEEVNQSHDLNFDEMEEVYTQDFGLLFNNFPRIDGAGFAEHFLGMLRKLATNLPDSISSIQNQFEILLGELEFFVSFLSDSKNKGLELRVNFFIYVVEYIIERLIHRDGPLCYHQLVLFIAVEEAGLLKEKILNHSHDEVSLEFPLQDVQQTFGEQYSKDRDLGTEGFVVGLDDQANIIAVQLQNSFKNLQVVSLVGMAGIGKTTLAWKVYNSTSIRNHFVVCAMCSVSQVYRKRKLLLDILGDFGEVTEEMKKKDDNDLALIVKRKLRGRRYLIVIDDIWKIEHWNDLKQSFPDDNLGSRILFTTRLRDVALLADPSMVPNILPLLSPKQSWDLLQAKVFDGEDCPNPFLGVGSLIARNCKGLPLAIVVVGGILKRTKKKKDQWEAIAEHLRSLIVDDPERHFTDILEFSYNHLPFNLKPCFLYLGSFLEDQEIPVKKLQWLWMGEGFIPTMDSKSLKETAEDYLKELTNRSLVMEVKRSSLGGTKTCRIHDMLRDLCVKKSKEEKFMQLVTMDKWNNSDSAVGKQYRMCVHSPKQAFIQLRPSASNVHSLLFFSTSNTQELSFYDISPIFKCFKLLRILDLEPITASIFPSGADLLVCLNYLAIKGNMKSVPPSISKLWNLETLVVKGTRGEIALPSTLWSMSTLQHVHVRPRASLTLCSPELENSLVLPNLASFSCPAISDWNEVKKILGMWIGVKNLRCTFLELKEWDSYLGGFVFPRMEFLTRLESLNVSYIGKIFPCELGFPRNIKKLTLSRFCFSWDYMSVIIQLCKLEVLKILIRAFEGDTWEMSEDCIFPKLRYLKMENLNIVSWTTCSEHFPELEILVLRGCKQLVTVPSSFGEVPTLQMIEMQLYSQTAIDSTQIILEQQLDLANPGFKIRTTEWIS